MSHISAQQGRGKAVRIELPWPDRDLHPNTRVHWARRARAAKTARKAGAAFTLAAGIRRIDAERIVAKITFHPPDNRPRDDDGMIASFKSYRDGIADVIGVDDSRWRIQPVVGEPVKGGAVLIELEAAPL